MTTLPEYLTHKREAVDRLHEAVERLCPVLNLLRNPQAIAGPVRRTAAPETARALSREGVA